MGPAYSTYHGRVRIPFVSPYTPISLGDGIYMDSGCPGHVVLGAPGNKEEPITKKEENITLARKRKL